MTSPQLVDLTHLSPEEEEERGTNKHDCNNDAAAARRGSGAAPEGDVILCTSYLELKERGTKRGTELETEQKRDTSMMKKEGMVSAHSRELQPF